MTPALDERRAAWRKEPGRIFVEAAAYADFDIWHEIATGLREESPVFEVAPARLDRGIQAAVALASAGVIFMGLLVGPLYAAASYGRAALLH